MIRAGCSTRTAATGSTGPGRTSATSPTFEDALAAARRARPAEAALPDLQRAIAAYGGDFLDGMSAGEWALVRRDELRRRLRVRAARAGRLQTAAGRHQAAAAAFRRAVAHEPLNETAHRELMSCWARLGETARAVRHYEELTEPAARAGRRPPAGRPPRCTGG